MIATCSFCLRKCEWYCKCSPAIPLCTFHTKEHRTLSCQLKRLKISKLCNRLKSILRLEIQSRITKLTECIQQIQTTTNRLLEIIKLKSETVLSNLINAKDLLVNELNRIKNCCEINNWYNYLTKVYTRKDTVDEKCFNGVNEYFDQVFFREEDKLNLILGHAEQAKYTLGKDHKLFIEGHFDCVSSVAVTNDNRFIVSGGDETIRIWDLEKYTQEGVITNPDSSILAVVVTENYKYIISGGVDAVVYVWDFSERRYKCELRGHTKSVLCLAVGKSNEIVVSGGEDGKVKIWNFIQKFLMANFDAHSNRVKSLVFSKDSKYIISGGWDENVKIWKFKKKSLFMTINFKPDYVNSVCHTCSYQVIVAHSNMISIYNLLGKKLERRFKAHEFRVNSLFLSQSGKYLVSSGQDNIVKLWDTTQFSVLSKLDLKIEISSIHLSADDKSLIIGCEDKTLKRWIVQTNELHTYECHTDTVNCVKVTGDNRFVITAGMDNEIMIWSLATRTLVATLKGHTDWIRALFVIPCNNYLISGGNDKIARIWDLSNMTCKIELTGSKLAITSITFCPIYNLVVTGTGALASVWLIKYEELCKI